MVELCVGMEAGERGEERERERERERLNASFILHIINLQYYDQL